MARELSQRARRFAEVYAGDGVLAAQLAGYTGKRSSLASIASRLLKDPRVQAIIEARRAAGEVVQAAGAPAVELAPEALMRKIANDSTLPASARLRAAEKLQQRADRATKSMSGEQALEALRQKVASILEAKARRGR